MIRIVGIIALVLFPPFVLWAQKTTSSFDIIPKPLSEEARAGYFIIDQKTSIYYEKTVENFDLAANFFIAALQPVSEFALRARPFVAENIPRDKGIYLLADPSLQNAEAYTLEITRTAVLVRANTAAGAFYALQTLRQLLSSDIYRSSPPAKPVNWILPPKIPRRECLQFFRCPIGCNRSIWCRSTIWCTGLCRCRARTR